MLLSCIDVVYYCRPLIGVLRCLVLQRERSPRICGIIATLYGGHVAHSSAGFFCASWQGYRVLGRGQISFTPHEGGELFATWRYPLRGLFCIALFARHVWPSKCAACIGPTNAPLVWPSTQERFGIEEIVQQMRRTSGPVGAVGKQDVLFVGDDSKEGQPPARGLIVKPRKSYRAN